MQQAWLSAHGFLWGISSVKFSLIYNSDKYIQVSHFKVKFLGSDLFKTTSTFNLELNDSNNADQYDSEVWVKLL